MNFVRAVLSPTQNEDQCTAESLLIALLQVAGQFVLVESAIEEARVALSSIEREDLVEVAGTAILLARFAVAALR